MLRVVYDGQIFASQSHGGVSRIFSQLITELQKNEIDVRILSLLTDNEYFNNKAFLKGFSFPGKIVMMKEINKRYAIYKLRQGNFDVFHPTNYNPYF